MMRGKWQKRGLIFRADKVAKWWHSHTMAPAAVELNEKTIRIYLGCWDEKGISRIGYIDVDSSNPAKIKNISKQPVLDIGRDGTFDENGVFPAHVSRIKKEIYLYYTGFMLGHKIRHYNFGGLAKSKNGRDFKRASEAPVLDRADEGLHVRAGQSVVMEKNIFHTCYSAGTGWVEVGGSKRPVYDVYYQQSKNGIDYQKNGKKILKCDHKVEHGLGRPQLIKLDGSYYVFYTRRMVDMKYHMGCSVSKDLKKWRRIDDWLNIPHGRKGEFDSEMVYFPAVISTSKGKTFLFYSGNHFGGGGIGYAEWCDD